MIQGRYLQNLLNNFKCVQSLHSFRNYSSSFETAQANLKKLKEEPDVETKLKLYALFKQASQGDVQGSRPGMMDFAGRAKFDAWTKLKGVTKEEAGRQYSVVVNGLLKTEQSESSSSPSAQQIDGLKPVDGLDVLLLFCTNDKNLFIPSKFNALTLEMYRGLTAALKASSESKTTSITVVTGNGNYFCSGNDLSNFAKMGTAPKEELAKMAAEARTVLQEYVQAYIDHEKPLIGLINGPAVGIAVTVLGLFDYVIATDKATFHTPFAPLGQSPEGVSSYTFPLLMGQLRASELLLVCKKISAAEAKEYGLINEIIEGSEFSEAALKKARAFSTLPPESLRINKVLMRSLHKENLTKTNELECKTIEQRWQSAECHRAVAAFLSRSAKK
ncbi:unnamed protein product [Caenorhabditis auriculariae]|uniref:ACB domain-containing protein n=1 Tax=Caenorhabditis auriculariae TaxID=2777116 RepID=A0A8S1HMU4_9PELO|nr:unnamed protein product [Caenorhabditis auriculariae]